jgi:polar amino acid transport system substrate-binding protein
MSNFKTSKMATVYFLLGILFIFTCQIAKADQLEQIKKRGALTCGVLGNVPIFGYMDPKTREPVGYDIDMCRLVAKHLNVKAELKIVAVPARITELNQGHVDILSAVMGWTPARAEQIDYSYADSNTLTVLGFPASVKYTSFSQLAGKRIGATNASTSLTAAQAKIPQASVVSFEDATQVLLALKQHKVDAVVFDEGSLRQYKNEVENTPDAIAVMVNPPILVESQGLGIRKGEPTLVNAVNQALRDADKAGEIDAVWDKYFGKDSDMKMARTFKVEKITE